MSAGIGCEGRYRDAGRNDMMRPGGLGECGTTEKKRTSGGCVRAVAESAEQQRRNERPEDASGRSQRVRNNREANERLGDASGRSRKVQYNREVNERLGDASGRSRRVHRFRRKIWRRSTFW